MRTPEAGAGAGDLRVFERREVDDEQWSDLLRADPRSHVAQRPSFLRTLAPDGARWLEVRDGDDRLRAGMGYLERRRGPFRRRVSGVGGTYGGPVAADADAEAERLLAATFTRFDPRTVHLEMVWAGRTPPRGDWRGLRPLPTAELPVDPDRDFDHFLSTVFGRKGRKECNRSERNGLRAVRETDADAWREFESVLAARGARWGVDLPDHGVVRQLLGTHGDDVMLFVVRDAVDRVVGAHLVLALPDELFAWVGTTERIEGANPATLLLREEARAVHESGRRRLNLGASLGIDGVHRYKEMLGATVGERWIVRDTAWWRAPFARRAQGVRA